MKLKEYKISIIWCFIAVYLFSGLILPINFAFSHSLYDTDVEYNCCESYQDDQADNITVEENDRNDFQEIDNDYFLDSLQKNEKPCCIIQKDKLNLENTLSALSKSNETMLFNDNLQQKNIINIRTNVGNTLAILRTVILLN